MRRVVEVNKTELRCRSNKPVHKIGDDKIQSCVFTNTKMLAMLVSRFVKAIAWAGTQISRRHDYLNQRGTGNLCQYLDGWYIAVWAYRYSKASMNMRAENKAKYAIIISVPGGLEVLRYGTKRATKFVCNGQGIKKIVKISILIANWCAMTVAPCQKSFRVWARSAFPVPVWQEWECKVFTW